MAMHSVSKTKVLALQSYPRCNISVTRVVPIGWVTLTTFRLVGSRVRTGTSALSQMHHPIYPRRTDWLGDSYRTGDATPSNLETTLPFLRRKSCTNSESSVEGTIKRILIALSRSALSSLAPLIKIPTAFKAFRWWI